MVIQNLDYFYDGQIRRYLEQVVRAFSGWQYRTGGTNPQTIMVPCRMALTNSMIASIIQNNSENTLMVCPMITVNLTSLRGRREDVQNPNFVDSRQVVEREIVNGKYTGNRGNSYTVDRIMPMPFELTIQVDIWTSNIDQKLQLLEQMLTVIYPGFDTQNGTNALDWTALTTMYVEDIIYTSRAIPVGANAAEIETASIQLKLPFWLTAPAKVKRQTLINQIITNVYNSEVSPNGLVQGDELIQVVTTPGNYAIKIAAGVITLVPETNETINWQTLIYQYGNLNPTVSQLRIYSSPDFDSTSTYIAGTIQLGSDPSQLLWQLVPETLPVNTLPAVNAVINPLQTFPGGKLPTPVDGVSYLLLNDIGPSQAWGNITASTNDIISYNNGTWAVTFDASATNTIEFVVNSYSGSQLKFLNGQWILSIDGVYEKGYWELVLSPTN
jgi:hypothetical protein